MATPNTNAHPRRPSRKASTAHSAVAISIGSDVPRNISSQYAWVTTMPTAAIRPAATAAQRGPRPSRDTSREASRYAATIPRKPPARAVITHSVGAALPNSA